VRVDRKGQEGRVTQDHKGVGCGIFFNFQVKMQGFTHFYCQKLLIGVRANLGGGTEPSLPEKYFDSAGKKLLC